MELLFAVRFGVEDVACPKNSAYCLSLLSQYTQQHFSCFLRRTLSLFVAGKFFTNSSPYFDEILDVFIDMFAL